MKKKLVISLLSVWMLSASILGCGNRAENVQKEETQIQQEEIAAEAEVPEEVVEIELDKLQFSRVITNLINNALKHNESDTEITVKMEKLSDDFSN